MNKYLVYVLLLVVGLGLGYSIPHGAKQGPVGGSDKLDQHFVYGLHAGLNDQLNADSSGNLSSSGTFNATTVTASLYNTATNNITSSSSPIAAGSAAAGHMIVAAGSTSANASTTAVTANSEIFLTVEQSTPIAGTTCNTTIPTSTPVVSSVVSGNGFIVKVANSPITNPLCLSFRVLN